MKSAPGLLAVDKTSAISPAGSLSVNECNDDGSCYEYSGDVSNVWSSRWCFERKGETWRDLVVDLRRETNVRGLVPAVGHGGNFCRAWKNSQKMEVGKPFKGKLDTTYSEHRVQRLLDS